MKTALSETAVGAVLSQGARSLAAAGLPAARLDAERLLGWALGVDRLGLLIEPLRQVSPHAMERFREALERRRRQEPIQHILECEEFGGLVLRTGPGALVPRPETELLVEWVLEREGREGPWRLAVDVGTGTGAIACALAVRVPHLRVLAVERSPAALALAADNIASLGLRARVELLAGDLLEPVAGAAGTVDLVIANPPYIRSADLADLPQEVRDWEPGEALDGGPDGMAVHRRLIAESPRVLRPGGWLLMEMGEGQAADLSAAMEAAGFEAVGVQQDLRGIERMIAARKR
ncbi:MAG: peptide chain release factor N(5)-glutamine methyltransferase [Candidatus Rokubacteria bacterium]|nr:peptide chain release factor N(5)-glutamine methyltransferase [Candidatus Rokubacteria bacterium]